jgi:DNA-binding GntR family transcriptional regulator
MVTWLFGGEVSSDEGRNITLKNEVYARLRQSIIMGHRLPGDKIDVREIAEEQGISITPIREALQMLHQEGLVTIKPHSGYLVTRLTLKQLRDLFEVREILELAAAERAASRISDEQIEALCRVYAGYSGDDDESYARYTDENRQFHRLVAEATGNRELAGLVARVHDRLARFMVMRRAGETMQHTHARIIEALRARDPAAARQAMLDELTDTRQVVLDRVIQEQGEAWHLDRRG